MKLYFTIFGVSIPSYGFSIVIGVILANIIALYLLSKNNHDSNDFFIIESYVFLGAIIGSKLLYLIISYKEIDWSKLFELKYFNQLMQGGFVFYGGLIGGLIAAFIAGKIHNINTIEYMRSYIFLIPFIHCFGRLGCFMAGCCYGIPYTGPGAVIYPDTSLAPSGVSLFPIQLVEASILLILSFILLILKLKSRNNTIEIYLISYSIIRFILEFYRYDAARGFIGTLSTSQWISLFIMITILFLKIKNVLHSSLFHSVLIQNNSKYK